MPWEVLGDGEKRRRYDNQKASRVKTSRVDVVGRLRIRKSLNASTWDEWHSYENVFQVFDV